MEYTRLDFGINIEKGTGKKSSGISENVSGNSIPQSNRESVSFVVFSRRAKTFPQKMTLLLLTAPFLKRC